MISEHRIKELILTSLRAVAVAEQAVSEQIELNDDTIILGAGGILDSIAFVNFSTDLEEKIEDEIGKEFILRLHEIHDLNKGKTSLIVQDMARIVTEIITRDHVNG